MRRALAGGCQQSSLRRSVADNQAALSQAPAIRHYADAMDRPNYITPSGYSALSREYGALLGDERPKLVEVISWAAGNGDRSENGDYIYGRKRLREIDRRLGWLAKRMKAAVVIDPAAQPDRARVWFGATVTIADED